MHRIVTMFLILLPFAGISQSHLRKNQDVFPSFGNYERKGWIFSPALTYMVPPLNDTEQRLFVASDSVYDITHNAGGKFGVGFEVGRFYVIDASKLISYVDFSVGFKSFRGNETFRAILDDPDRSSPYFLDGTGTFLERYATAAFNASNLKQFSDKLFLTNSLGINADYKFDESVTFNSRRLPLELAKAPNLQFQIHYKIGVGFKVSQKFLLIPSVETPILTVYAYDELKSTMQIFNSRYRPLIFRLSIMMFDNKANRKCPPKGGKKRKSSESLFGMADSNRPW